MAIEKDDQSIRAERKWLAVSHWGCRGLLLVSIVALLVIRTMRGGDVWIAQPFVWISVAIVCAAFLMIFSVNPRWYANIKRAFYHRDKSDVGHD